MFVEVGVAVTTSPVLALRPCPVGDADQVIVLEVPLAVKVMVELGDVVDGLAEALRLQAGVLGVQLTVKLPVVGSLSLLLQLGFGVLRKQRTI